jgi:hypothetical protein
MKITAMGKESESLRRIIRGLVKEAMDMTPNVSTSDSLENLKRFVEDKIDFEGYSNYEGTPRSQRVQNAIEVFKDEMGWSVKQSGLKRAFIDWLQGLPSILDLPYNYWDIKNLMYSLGYDEVEDMEDQDIAKLYYDELFKVFFKNRN